MTCPKCGFHVPERAARCPNCLEALSHRGILRQILAGLGIGRSSASPASTETPPTEIRTERVKVRERIQVRDPRTGKTHVYGSLEEVRQSTARRSRRHGARQGRAGLTRR